MEPGSASRDAASSLPAPGIEGLRARLREALGGRPSPAARGMTPPAHTSAPTWPSRGEPSSDLHHLLPGFWQDTPAGQVFVVERRFELDHRHGRFLLGRTLETSSQVWARISREPALAGVDPRRAAFIDIETTSLAGGAGTLAFLVGVGHFLDGHFRLRQYFLGSLGQERALLRALTDYLDSFEAVVTFNGKSFDLPQLQTRLVLCGLPAGFTALPHFDLLHPARRLYRDRLTSCRLGHLELWLLGLTRVDDVPGAEVPSLYFRYIRHWRARAMLPVFEHNALDVLSLVTLTAHLCRLFSGEARLAGGDRLALGRDCESGGRDDEALAHYAAALGGELAPMQRLECERRLSLLYKRLGRWPEAAALWQQVAARSDNHALYPLQELAKYHERITRDLEAARLAVERALLLLDRHHARLGYPAAAERAALHKRLLRIEERAARHRSRPARTGRTGVRVPAGGDGAMPSPA